MRCTNPIGVRGREVGRRDRRSRVAGCSRGAVRAGQGSGAARPDDGSGSNRSLPSTFAGLLAQIAEKFARGLGAIRQPGRLLLSLAWSFPLWLSIVPRHLGGRRRLPVRDPVHRLVSAVALLVLGVAVPTPGAVGGFHEAFRVGATMFFGAPDDAAVGRGDRAACCSRSVPSLLLGLFFAAQAGLNVTGMRRHRRRGRAGARRRSEPR